MIKQVEQILFQTVDPTVTLRGRPVPALTTILHQVCGNDRVKFAEATRIIKLFIERALKAEG